MARPLVRLRAPRVLRELPVAQQRLLLRVLPVPLALQQAVQLQALLDLWWKEALMQYRPRTRRLASSSVNVLDAMQRPARRWIALNRRPNQERERVVPVRPRQLRRPLPRPPHSLATRITRFLLRIC